MEYKTNLTFNTTPYLIQNNSGYMICKFLKLPVDYQRIFQVGKFICEQGKVHVDLPTLFPQFGSIR
ncbi:hypothetical protein L0128_04080 [candidate division KSB1 bacterium]|nr:hypothetical protein [candidate division KSB1 bacterium]